MAQHGMRESGLYQLIHLQGSGAPHMENPDWSSEPLRALHLDFSVFYGVSPVDFRKKNKETLMWQHLDMSLIVLLSL